MKKLFHCIVLSMIFALLLLLPKADSLAANNKYQLALKINDEGTDHVDINGISYYENTLLYFEEDQTVTYRLFPSAKKRSWAYLSWHDSTRVYDPTTRIGSFPMPGENIYLGIASYDCIDGEVELTYSSSGTNVVVSEHGQEVKANLTVTASLKNSSSVNSSNLHYEWVSLKPSGKKDAVLGTEASYKLTTTDLENGKDIRCHVYDYDISSEYYLQSYQIHVVGGTTRPIVFKLVNDGAITFDGRYNTSLNNRDIPATGQTVPYPPGSKVSFSIAEGYTATISATSNGSDVTVYEDGDNHRYFYMTTTPVEVKITFSTNLDIARAIRIECPDLTFNGDYQLPEPVVKTTSGKVLVKDIDYQLNTYEGKGKNAGGYYGSLYVYLNGNNSNTAKRYFAFTINPSSSGWASLTSTASTVYNGNIIKPTITVSSDISDTLVEGTDYIVSYPNSVNAGHYEATVTFIGNYSGSKKIAYTISPSATFGASLSKLSYPYTGSAIKPLISVVDANGKTLLAGKDYDIIASGVNTGTYEATVKLKGNYTGSKKLSYTITPNSNVTTSMSKANNTYTGSNVKPKVVALDSNNNTLVEGRDYTITYPAKSRAVGSYKLSVNYIGNYSGSFALNFTVSPKNTSISGNKADKTSITVKWKKQTKESSGYQVRYSLNADMSSSKTITVSGNTKTSLKISKLKSKKTYYIQICTYKTVKGKKICSDWSKTKTIKTK